MNFRAIALGTVIGFIVAVVPSCSSTKCAASNCPGCCDAKGQCVKSPNNGNNTTCGTQGNACVDCTKLATPTSCSSTFSCGAGGGTGGGSGTCDGCKLPSSGNCVSLANTSVVNCGINGAVCQACPTSQQCNNGVCSGIDAGPILGYLGDPCTSDSQCNKGALSGGKGFCKKISVPGNLPYQGGYCTRRCTQSTECGGTDNKCAYFMGFTGELENICYKGCASESDCRTPAYGCVNYGSPQKPYTFCTPLLPDGGLNEYDAGPGNYGGHTGACTTDSQCGPQPEFLCISDTLSDGGASGFTGGACTGDCSLGVLDAFCGDGGTCYPYLATTDQRGPLVAWQCGEKCFGNGSLGCRTGYVCRVLVTDTTEGTCVPNCANAPPGFCRNSCNVDAGLCQ